MDYNKLEKAVRGISMPEETAHKIISECKKYEGNPVADEDFSQQVSGVETVKSNRILRYTAIAASLVLVAGGVGLAAHLAGRPKENNNHLEEVEVDSTDIQQSTQSITATEAPTIIDIPESLKPDSTTTESINYKEIYYSYIDEKLIPQYGMASLENFKVTESAETHLNFVIPSQALGIVSADISDYTGDGVPDMLAVIYDESEENYDWILQLYSCKDEDIYMIDEYVASYGKICVFKDSYFSLQKVSGKLVIHTEYTPIDGGVSDYTILGIYENDFSEEVKLDTYSYGGIEFYMSGEKIEFDAPEGLTEKEWTSAYIEYGCAEIEKKLNELQIKYMSLHCSENSGLVINFDNTEQITLYTENDYIVTPNDFTNLRAYWDVYPPFGNFEKMSSGPYKVTGFCGEEKIHESEVAGKILHAALYGYKWTICEVPEIDVVSEDINFFRIEIQKASGYETVTVDQNGYVTWYINCDDTVRYYKLNDTRAFEMIKSNV